MMHGSAVPTIFHKDTNDGKRRKLSFSPDRCNKSTGAPILTGRSSQTITILTKYNIAHCVNCDIALDTEDKSEFVKAFKPIQIIEEDPRVNISILDAILYIYGICLEDLVKEGMSKMYDRDEENVILCTHCGSTLEEMYHSHRKFNNASKNEAVLRKAITKSRQQYVTVKKEPELEYEYPEYNNVNVFEEERNEEIPPEQFKYEVDPNSIYSDDSTVVKPVNLINLLTSTQETTSHENLSRNAEQNTIINGMDIEATKSDQYLPAMCAQNFEMRETSNIQGTNLESLSMEKPYSSKQHNIMSENTEFIPQLRRETSNVFNSFDFNLSRGDGNFVISDYVPCGSNGGVYTDQFQCSVCQQYFKNLSSLRRHHSRFHRPDLAKTFFCSICGKTTKNMTNMRLHQQVHDPVRNPNGGYRARKIIQEENSLSFSDEIITGDVFSDQ